MLLWSWDKWSGPLGDTGRELYIPWQINEGQALYRDIAYFNGPLSPYINAAFFRLFGVSLRTLVLSNLVILALILFLLYRLLESISGWIAATAAGLAFVSVFAFGQLVQVGNYNYVCPYSHEFTHGILLTLLALFCLHYYHRSNHPAWCALSGLLPGLVFLTKAEIFLAAAAAVFCGLAVVFASEKPGMKRGLLHGAIFIAAFAAPVVTSLVFLSGHMPFKQALLGTLGTWPYILDGRIAKMHFYQWQTGMLAPGLALWILFKWALGYAAVFGLAATAALFISRRTRQFQQWAAGLLAAGVLIGLLPVRSPFFWLRTVRPLPLFLLILVFWAGIKLWRGRQSAPEERQRNALRLVFLVWALALLAKMILHARVFHYGFGLAMPGTMALIAALCAWVPEGINRRGGAGFVFRAVAIAALLTAIAGHLRICHGFYSAKTYRVSHGADSFLADERAVPINLFLTHARGQMKEEDNFVVIPEGVMLNYLSRRTNPTRHISFVPTEISTLDAEEFVLQALQEDAPDYFVVVHKDTSDYGVRFFGRDYAQSIYAWVRREYRPDWLAGAPPLRDDRFGIQVLRRQDDVRNAR
jgi:hypothetical protein